MAQQIVNNGDSGAVARSKINSMFTEVYSALVLPIKIPGINANITQVIPANTWLESILVRTASGTPTIRVGTTPNGTDVMPDTQPGATSEVLVQEYFPTDTTLYITISGTGSVNMRLNTVNNVY
jgi:hypothetical protein